VAVAWVLVTPLYNVFLRHATSNLLHLFESPNVTTLQPADRHTVMVLRADLAARGSLREIRVTDLHFPLILLAALFLATPGPTLGERLSSLGVAILVSAFFHLVLFTFYVQFVYATQLGSWSGERYSHAAQIFWGLGKHLLDLPFKFALPLLLWAASYLDRLRPANG
jgi:hypothetical protein